jgi:hypothetical protein
MRYRVDWLQTALDQLTEIWMQADALLRKAITQATHQIDRQLERDPLAQSESRPDGRRILHSPPLGVLFRIELDGRTVSVLRVWVYRKKAKP